MKAFARRHSSVLLLAATVVIATPFISMDPVTIDTSIITGIYALIALSVGLTWGQVRLLSVAQGAFAATGGYASAILCLRLGASPFIGLVAAILLPAIVAYPLARVFTRLSALALAVATLAFADVFYTVLRQSGHLSGGYVGLSAIPEVPGIVKPLDFHRLVWILVIVVVALYANLMRSAYGRTLGVIRQDRVRAAADGVNVPHVLGVVFSAAASVAGLAGWLYAHYVSYMSPESLGPTLSISVLLMAIIGGGGVVLGPIVGAAIHTEVFKYLPAEELHGFFYGLALIVVLILAPEGILKGLTTVWRPRRKGVVGARATTGAPDATPADRDASGSEGAAGRSSDTVSASDAQ